ncbi:MAG: hypothetical protein ABJK11_11110 [Balneola sp.]
MSRRRTKSNFKAVNERREKEGKSHFGHYRPKSEFRRQRLQEHIQRVSPEKNEELEKVLTLEH